jgi:hypothetical protein
MKLTWKNVVAFLMTSVPTAGVTVALAFLQPSAIYIGTLIAVFAFHLSGAWLQAVQPSIKAQAEGATK